LATIGPKNRQVVEKQDKEKNMFGATACKAGTKLDWALLDGVGGSALPTRGRRWIHAAPARALASHKSGAIACHWQYRRGGQCTPGRSLLSRVPENGARGLKGEIGNELASVQHRAKIYP
jgi:hypothetical protein